jgi:hypothetical protein
VKRQIFFVLLLAGFSTAAGCKKQQQAAPDAIRDGIQQHLTSLKTLNLSAMNMNVTNESVNGDTAQAQVEFTPKTGAPPGAAMRVSYSLEKRGGQWMVVKTNALPGAIDHPAPGANPHTQAGPADVHGTLPNFRDMIPSSTPDSSPSLPPGHPPVASSETPKQY